MGRLRAFLHRVARHLQPGSRRPAHVRRAAFHCPHTEDLVEADLLMDPSGAPRMILRCSARSDHPPGCDQLCLSRAEAVLGPAASLLLIPPDAEDEPEEID
jgi:hypothetical protein